MRNAISIIFGGVLAAASLMCGTSAVAMAGNVTEFDALANRPNIPNIRSANTSNLNGSGGRGASAKKIAQGFELNPAWAHSGYDYYIGNNTVIAGIDQNTTNQRYPFNNAREVQQTLVVDERSASAAAVPKAIIYPMMFGCLLLLQYLARRKPKDTLMR